MHDPQTSGGLLVALDAARADELVAAVAGAARIGEVLPAADEAIRFA